MEVRELIPKYGKPIKETDHCTLWDYVSVNCASGTSHRIELIVEKEYPSMVQLRYARYNKGGHFLPEAPTIPIENASVLHALAVAKGFYNITSNQPIEIHEPA
jgi:hypothetical protein